MLWTNADRCGLDTRKIFRPPVREYKQPRGRPRKLPVEVLKCERAPGWYWSDFVSADECQAGDKFHEDWRASGLRPVQTQQFRRGDCGSQARSHITAALDDQESWSPPGSTNTGQDATDRIERALTPSGLTDEPLPQAQPRGCLVKFDRVAGHRLGWNGAKWKPVAARRLSPAQVERLVDQFLGPTQVFNERGKLLEHRYPDGRVVTFQKPKRVKRERPNMASRAKRGMQELVDPADCTQWPVDDVAGRHRLEHRWALEMLERDERELLEAVVLQGRHSTDVAGLRRALSKLSVHYRRHDYEAYVDGRLAVEKRKAQIWLTSRGLCL